MKSIVSGARPAQLTMAATGGVSATTRPWATTYHGRTWRRRASNGSVAGSTIKLAGLPATMP